MEKDKRDDPRGETLQSGFVVKRVVAFKYDYIGILRHLHVFILPKENIYFAIFDWQRGLQAVAGRESGRRL